MEAKTTMIIEKGVPMPSHGLSASKLFRKMQVGDSVFSRKRKIANAMRACKRTDMEVEFTEFYVEENGVTGYRIWRTK